MTFGWTDSLKLLTEYSMSWCISSLFSPEWVAPHCLSLPIPHHPSTVIIELALLSAAYSPSNFCVFHLLPHSPTSVSLILSLCLSHTHQCLRHTRPAPLLPLQLHFICRRCSRVARLNDSVQPVVGVWVPLIMPVSLWGEKYRQIRPEKELRPCVIPPVGGPHRPNQRRK